MSSPWTWQLLHLLTSLPVLLTMGCLVVWSLLRLHERPRAGWTVLGLVFLWGVMNFGLTGLLTVANALGTAGFINGLEPVLIAWTVLHGLISLAIWGWVGYEFWREPPEHEHDAALVTE